MCHWSIWNNMKTNRCETLFQEVEWGSWFIRLMTSRIDLERGENNFGVTEGKREGWKNVKSGAHHRTRSSSVHTRCWLQIVGAHGITENPHVWRLASKSCTPNTAGLEGVLRYSTSSIPKVNSIRFSSSRPDTKSGSQWKVRYRQARECNQKFRRWGPRRILNSSRRPAVQWRSRTAIKSHSWAARCQQGKYEEKRKKKWKGGREALNI